MSSLNINNLYETMWEKNMKRYEKFDGILKKIHNRIKYNARLEKTYCFFQIPEFIFGVPLYNINDMKDEELNELREIVNNEYERRQEERRELLESIRKAYIASYE